MGMDVCFNYEYTDEYGDKVVDEFMDLRKPYWLNTVICKYLNISSDKSQYCEISLRDLIGLRNFFQLCLDYPKMVNIVGDGEPWMDTLAVAVNEINTFLASEWVEDLTGKLYYDCSR